MTAPPRAKVRSQRPRISAVSGRSALALAAWLSTRPASWTLSATLLGPTTLSRTSRPAAITSWPTPSPHNTPNSTGAPRLFASSLGASRQSTQRCGTGREPGVGRSATGSAKPFLCSTDVTIAFARVASVSVLGRKGSGFASGEAHLVYRRRRRARLGESRLEDQLHVGGGLGRADLAVFLEHEPGTLPR